MIRRIFSRRQCLSFALVTLAGLGFSRKADAAAGYWHCTNQECGHVYDPELGDSTQNIAPGTRFEELPADWVCPLCGGPKSAYRPVPGQ